MEHKKDDGHKEEKRSIEELYLPIAKQFKLPEYGTLNHEFEIDTLDPECKHLVKEVAKRVFDKLELFKKILETMVQPDVSVLSMQETEFLTDKDHELVADVLNRLMRMDRTLLLAELENDEQQYAEFIIEAAKEWAKIKQELAPIIKRMQQGWSAKRKDSHFKNYLG